MIPTRILAPDPVRPLDVSPSGVSPHIVSPLVVSPPPPPPPPPPSRFSPSRFAHWSIRLKNKNQPILLKSMLKVSANIFAMLYARNNVFNS